MLALGFVLFSIVLARVRVYDEAEVLEGGDARRRPGFRLSSEFRYKRQVVWVLVDATTIVLSMYGSYLFLFGGRPDWAVEVIRFARVTPVAVATVLTWLMVLGLYRTDWQQFSAREGVSIVLGTTTGLALTLDLFIGGPASDRRQARHIRGGMGCDHGISRRYAVVREVARRRTALRQ